MNELIQFLRTIDEQLFMYTQEYGLTIYLVIFAIVYSKTAFVVLAFLPGDSLTFASGTLAATQMLDLPLLFFLIFCAAVVGDSQNYWLGKLFRKLPYKTTVTYRLIPADTINYAQQSLQQFDSTIITFSRFVPMMRVFIPFSAGYSDIQYTRFLRFNVIGAFFWTSAWLGSGFILGNIPFVQQNIALTLLIITLLMIIISLTAYLRQSLRNRLS